MYVSCRYGPPPPIPIDPQMVACTDEEGVEWWFDPETSTDQQWLFFKENGGEVTPYEEPR